MKTKGRPISGIFIWLFLFLLGVQFPGFAWSGPESVVPTPKLTKNQKIARAVKACLENRGIDAHGFDVEVLPRDDGDVIDLTIYRESVTNLDLLMLDVLPIEALCLHGPGQTVIDLSPLSNSSLTELRLKGVRVKDLTPLKNLDLTFISFTLDENTRGIDVLRDMRSLDTIYVHVGKMKYIFPVANSNTTFSAIEDFWRAYSAGELTARQPETK